MIKKLFKSFSNINIYQFVISATLLVIISSMPMVYIITKIFDEPYSVFLFSASIAIPSLIAPPIFYNVIKMMNHLSSFQKELNIAIEENKKKELMLYEQARFAFMGEMLSNISHQWRQPLNTINLAIFSAKMEFENKNLSDKKLLDTFNLIESNTLHLSDTIDDFKQFFQQKNTQELKLLSDIIEEVQNVVSTILHYDDISLEIYTDKIENVYLYSSISQVILNLIANSIDALKVVQKDNKKIIINYSIIDDIIKIRCCDNGCGIDDAIVKNIFDPYFTTKEKSQGTGIGLYMSRQIIQKFFDGELVVVPHSTYTCFEIRVNYKKQKEEA